VSNFSWVLVERDFFFLSRFINSWLNMFVILFVSVCGKFMMFSIKFWRIVAYGDCPLILNFWEDGRVM
jgi:hypothetical protein